MADLTDGGPPQGVGLTLRRQAACGSAERVPCTHRVAARALRSAVEESDSLASRCRDCAGNESADPANVAHIGYAAPLSCRNASRTEHKSSYIQSRPICRIPLARDPRQTGPRRLPRDPPRRRPGSLRYNCVLCPIRLLHCHAACFPDLALVRALEASAARTAPVRRHPSRQLRRSACNANSRVCNPKVPRPPRMLAPSIPRGLRKRQVALPLFRSGFFCVCVSLHRPHGVSPRPARPLVVPSKDYSHGGGLGLPLLHEGRRTEDAQQSRKKRP
jgi:hypothetical protein